MLITCELAREVGSFLNLKNPCGLTELELETWKPKLEVSFVVEFFEISE